VKNPLEMKDSTDLGALKVKDEINVDSQYRIERLDDT